MYCKWCYWLIDFYVMFYKQRMWPCVCAERIVLKIREAGFSVAAQKETVLTKELAEELFDTSKEKEYFHELIQSLTRFAMYYCAGYSNSQTTGTTIVLQQCNQVQHQHQDNRMRDRDQWSSSSSPRASPRLERGRFHEWQVAMLSWVRCWADGGLHLETSDAIR